MSGDDSPVRVHMPALLAGEFGISRSEARRALAQGAVRVGGRLVTDLDVELDDDPVVVELGRTHAQVVRAIVSGMTGEGGGD